MLNSAPEIVSPPPSQPAGARAKDLAFGYGGSESWFTATVERVRGPDQVIVEYLAEVWSKGDPDRAAEFIHDDYDLGDLGRGPAAVAENVATFRRAFPDLSIAVDELVADGERVAVWMRLAGTHRGAFRGHAPTGRHVTWDEVGFFTVRGDRIVAGRFLADMFGLRKALGVLPADMR